MREVAQRMRSLIARLEAEHQGAHLVLVSHGDALSILASVRAASGPGEHRRALCGVHRVCKAQDGCEGLPTLAVGGPPDWVYAAAAGAAQCAPLLTIYGIEL